MYIQLQLSYNIRNSDFCALWQASKKVNQQRKHVQKAFQFLSLNITALNQNLKYSKIFSLTYFAMRKQKSSKAMFNYS